jgi:rubrerythrin
MSETLTEEPEITFEGSDDAGEPGDQPITEEDAAEQADDGDDFDPEPAEPESEPESRGLSEQEIEQRYKALEREQKRHTAAIAKVLGDEAPELIVCPLCEPELQGFLRMESFDHPRDEIHEAMIGVLKRPSQVEYRPAPHAVTCIDCDGLGEVLSGSHVAGKERIVCPTCNGQGFVTAGGSTANGSTGTTAIDFAPPSLDRAANEELRDDFGSPETLPDGRSNPNYGKTMKYKDPTIEDDYLKRLAGAL